MRSLTDFSKGEWLRNKPLDHFMVQFCNDGFQRAFRAVRPKSLARFLENTAHLRGENIGLVVAYEQPWTLEWLLRMARRHLLDATLLVFDNSRSRSARLDIERVCRDAETAYLALPPNPTNHPNRSHGMAMTWVFHNVVRKIEPRMFTFIDHDLIPLEKAELGRELGAQPFYGVPNVSAWGWSLWAGYCSYDFADVGSLPLNFLNDFSRGLDTGGRNWSCLYSKFDRARMRLASQRPIALMDPVEGDSRRMSVIDGSWVHLGGAGYGGRFKKNRDFYERLARASEEGATLSALTESGPALQTLVRNPA